jgi:hypothetical protein
MNGTSIVPVLIVVIIVAKTKKIIRSFINSGATSPAKARTTEELNIRRSGIFNRLVRRGVLVEIADRFYIHEQNLIAYNSRRRTIMIAVLAILLLLILLDIAFMTSYFG